MALSDKKKVQTMVNIAAEQIVIIRAAIDSLKDTRTLFLSSCPSLSGTCISGSLASINSALNILDTVVNSGSTGTTWNNIEGCHVPSHNNQAL